MKVTKGHNYLNKSAAQNSRYLAPSTWTIYWNFFIWKNAFSVLRGRHSLLYFYFYLKSRTFFKDGWFCRRTKYKPCFFLLVGSNFAYCKSCIYFISFFISISIQFLLHFRKHSLGIGKPVTMATILCKWFVKIWRMIIQWLRYRWLKNLRQVSFLCRYSGLISLRFCHGIPF